MEWKDATSYSHRGTGRGKGECEPQTWYLVAGDFRLVVTRWIYGDPQRWYLLCNSLGVDSHREIIFDDDLEAAKSAAIDWARRELRDRIERDKQLLADLSLFV